MLRFSILSTAAVMALSACGGGGDSSTEEHLLVKAEFGYYEANLFSQVTLQPRSMSGFNGHAPACTLASGSSLPQGLTLNRDCTITGAATTDGRRSFSINVSAEGANNSIPAYGEIRVFGPTLSYLGEAHFTRTSSGSGTTAIDGGSVVTTAPKVYNWTPPAGLQYSVSYEVSAGALPPGLTLNPATGVVTGTATTPGTYWASIMGVFNTSAGVFKTDAKYNNFSVTVSNPSPKFSYPVSSGREYLVVYNGIPTTIVPVLDGTYSLFNFAGKVPAGMTLDPATGVISGIPTVSGTTTNPDTGWLYDSTAYYPMGYMGDGSYFPLTADLSWNGSTLGASTTARIVMAHPVYLNYPTLKPVTDVPFSVTPHIKPTSSHSIEGVSYSFYTRSGCPFEVGKPSVYGLTLDESTGQVSGMLTQPLPNFTCTMGVRVTLNGASWNQDITLSQ